MSTSLSRQLAQIKSASKGHDRPGDSVFSSGPFVVKDGDKLDPAKLEYLAKDGLDWPFQIGQMERMKSSLAKQYGVREIPTKYLVGKDGEIVGVNMSIPEIDQWLSERD